MLIQGKLKDVKAAPMYDDNLMKQVEIVSGAYIGSMMDTLRLLREAVQEIGGKGKCIAAACRAGGPGLIPGPGQNYV
jgi:hypothetical protein